MTTTRDTLYLIIHHSNLTRERSNIVWVFNKTETTEVSMEVSLLRI
jgi:hypothetical protein